MNMMRFYAMLAGDGSVGTPFLVQAQKEGRRSLGLTPDQLQGLRTALSRVVSSGTASGSGGRELDVAGKTGTAQNPHGSDHGWFIGYAPANNPKIVVGAIVESLGGHGGAFVAPWVVRVIRRFLSEEDPTLSKAKIKVPVLEDSVARPDTIP